jgi:hypothetical protein
MAVDSDVLDRIAEEKVWLEHSIACRKRKWVTTAKLLREAFEAYVVLTACLDDLDHATQAADDEWARNVQAESQKEARSMAERRHCHEAAGCTNGPVV